MNPTIGKIFEITDDYVVDGKQCYEVNLNTACCKGKYDLWRKSEKEVFDLQTGEKMNEGTVVLLNRELKTYKKK